MAAVSYKYRRGYRGASSAVGDAVLLCFAAGLIGAVLITTAAEASVKEGGRSSVVAEKACEEIYVVGEGESLHSISDKCRDPYIVERNPHIHDPDDVFPGLVIKIVPLYPL